MRWQPLDFVLLALLFPLAALLPLPLYVASLAIFGLPHVIWELRWLQLAGHRIFSIRLIAGLLACLALLVIGRTALAMNISWAAWSPWLDVSALLAALVVVLPNVPPKRRLWCFALMSCLAACLIIQSLELLIVLLITLSVAHNFTPLALMRWRVPANAKLHSQLLLVFMLPLILLLLGGFGISQNLGYWLQKSLSFSMIVPWHMQPGETTWLKSYGIFDHWLHGILSALVSWQCLHYMAVLRWMPRTLSISSGAQQNVPAIQWSWSGSVLWQIVIGFSVLMTLSFVIDFHQGRMFYAIAAGVHAWLEWPLLFAYKNQAAIGAST